MVVICVINILIVGYNNFTNKFIQALHQSENLKIVAIINNEENEEVKSLASRLQIEVKSNLNNIQKHIDYICLMENKQELISTLQEKFKDAQIIQGEIFSHFFYTITNMEQKIKNQENEIINLQLIFNNIRDGLIVIDRNENIQFINKAAKKILGVSNQKINGDHIRKYIKNSKLPNVLRSQQKEVNQSFVLDNNKKIITTRIPLINNQKRLIGAFAIFKISDEVIQLAEENTDLKEVKTMLEAIIQSSDEAISVVDENGNGLMINPAYTRITGLTEKEVIGQPATVDISEGESMHMKVLKTRRPIRGTKMKVGPHKKEVIVNVAPIIVNGKLKGSIGVIHDISEIKKLTSELERAKQIIRNLEASFTFDDIIGSSPEMMIAIEQAKIGAKTPATVLLKGASGTGKELFAHAIHNESDRKYNKFIRVNCAALSESVIESELFGYEEGAFTGAKSGGKIGLFEEANMGSIFLDEISELSLSMQAKLLRVIQEKEIVRVGGTTPIPLDIRVIAATNINLERAITKKEFREDLYYRLNRLPIYIPSLKERITDLPDLVDHLIAKINQMYGRNVSSITNEALAELMTYHWPGNVRELENVISRAIIFMDITEEVIDKRHLPNFYDINEKTVKEDTSPSNKISLKESGEQYENHFIAEAYKQNKYNKTKTTQQLNISVRNLYYKIEKYNLDK